MNEKTPDTGELISALLDGELSASELGLAVDAASRAPQGLAAWQSYLLVGETLRGKPPAPASDGGLFLARLREKLADEVPARPVAPVAEPVSARVAASVQHDSANDAVVRWKLVAGAASLAAVAVFGWHMASTQLPVQSLAQLPAPSSASAVQPAGAPAAGTAPASAPPVMLRDARLDALMAAHKQYGGTSALQMPAGFLRNATFDGSER